MNVITYKMRRKYLLYGDLLRSQHWSYILAAREAYDKAVEKSEKYVSPKR